MLVLPLRSKSVGRKVNKVIQIQDGCHYGNSDRGRRPEGGLPGVFQRQSRFGRHDTRVKA